MIATLNANLRVDAEVFKRLREKPDWWNKLISLSGVYVEIRKDNIVDVYFEGGCMAKLTCKNNELTATCHPKYLGKNIPKGYKSNYEDCLYMLKKDPESIIKK